MKKAFLISILSIFLLNFNKAQHSNELIIQTKPDVEIAEIIKTVFQKHQIKLFLKEVIIPEKNIFLLASPLSKAPNQNIIQLLKQESTIKYIGESRAVDFRNTEPNDTLFSEQQNLFKCQFPAAWDITKGGKTADEKEIVIAVIDGGFLIDHPDFEGQLYENPDEIPNNGEDDDLNGFVDDIHGWNFRGSISSNDGPIYFNHEHGTQVAGILGAKPDNIAGISGAAWNTKMMLLGIENDFDVMKAYQYILDERRLYNETDGEKGTFIVAINGSFGFKNSTCDDYPILRDYFDEFGEAGILYVASTANSTIDVDSVSDFPTGCMSDFLVTVTNSTLDDELDDSVGFGATSIDLAAPGNEIHTTHNDGDYIFHEMGGASFSAPLVSAAVGLLYSVPCFDLTDLAMEHPAEAALLIKESILEGVDEIPVLRDKTLSNGRLNVFNSLNYLHGYCIARSEEQEEGRFEEIYLEEKEVVRLYPNPSYDVINLDYSVPSFGTVTIKVFNILGQLILEKEIETTPFEMQTTEIETWNWAVGTYILTIEGEEKKASLRFLKH